MVESSVRGRKFRQIIDQFMDGEIPRRVLIVGPSWVGDMVMAQALFKVIKQRRPDTVIDVLAPAWSRPLLERMPEVRGAIDMPAGHGQMLLRARYRLGQSLRGQYDQAILLPNSLKSALVPLFAKIPVRTGWRGEMRYGLLNDLRWLDKRRYPLMVERFIALGFTEGAALPKQLPHPELVVENSKLPALLSHFESEGVTLNRRRPILALCPGAEFGPAKRWPERHYSAVAAAKISAGWQVWLMGSGNDNAVAEAIRSLLPPALRQYCVNLAGVTALAEAIDLLSLAAAVVSNDSGLMHIAAALRRPLVVVYGSTSPKFTPPLAKDVRIESISVECGPCFQRQCPQRHLKCLNDLEPAQVLNALEQLIATDEVESCTGNTAPEPRALGD
ncbi:MAG: lipopolysaccharide heptosyltransferase II [Exilibacterium sp.]